MSRWAALLFWAATASAAETAATVPAVSVSTAPEAPAPRTVITSRKVRVLDRGRAVEFTGEVTLTREGDQLTADRVVTQEGNTIARAWGRVTLRRRSPVENLMWEAWGDEAVYDTAGSSGTLFGVLSPARAARSVVQDGAKKELRFELAARRITFFEERPVAPSTAAASMAEADGGVYIRSEETAPKPRRTELWAGRAAFDGREGRLTLEGGFEVPPGFSGARPPEATDRPFSRQTMGREIRDVSGEVMTYRPAVRRLVVERRALARVLYEPRTSATADAPRRKEKKRGVAR